MVFVLNCSICARNALVSLVSLVIEGLGMVIGMFVPFLIIVVGFLLLG